MTLLIFIESPRVTLKLLKNRRVLDPAPFEDCASRKNQDLTVLKRCGVDSETFSYYHDLSDLLITALDKLLKRNSIDAKALKSYKILGNLGQNSTSYKIAAAFIEGLKVKT